MSRTLFGNEGFTSENIKDDDDGVSLTQLADEIYTAEVMLAYQETDIEADETVELVAETTSENLSLITQALADKEKIDKLTYESYVNTINIASKLLGSELTIEHVPADTWDEKKQETLADLETTVEGFVGDIMSSIANVGRRLRRSLKNLMVSLYTKQSSLGKMAAKLEKKMAKRSAGDVEGKTVKSLTASEWFKSPDDVIPYLQTMVGLRQAVPVVQEGLKRLPDTLSGQELDVKLISNELIELMRNFSRVPGVVKDEVSKDGIEGTTIDIPDAKGKTWKVTFAINTAAVTSLVVAAKFAWRPYLSAIMYGSFTTAMAIYAGVMVAMYVGGKVVKYVLTPNLPALKWDEISGTLDNIKEMSGNPITLSGLSGALSKIEKLAKKANSSSEDHKQAFKDIVKLTNTLSKIFVQIYKSSIGCSKSAMAYATASLKVHLKAGATGENIKEDPFYQDLDLVNNKFDELHDLLNKDLAI